MKMRRFLSLTRHSCSRAYPGVQDDDAPVNGHGYAGKLGDRDAQDEGGHALGVQVDEARVRRDDAQAQVQVHEARNEGLHGRASSTAPEVQRDAKLVHLNASHLCLIKSPQTTRARPVSLPV